MLHKHFWVSLILLLTVEFANAQDASKFIPIDTPPPDMWLELGKSTNQTQFFTKGIKKQASIHEFWLKSVSKSPKECSSAFQNPFDAATCERLKRTNAEQEISRVQLDCKARTSRTLGFISYNYNGDVIDRGEYPNAKWRMIFPETMMEVFSEIYC